MGKSLRDNMIKMQARRHILSLLLWVPIFAATAQQPSLPPGGSLFERYPESLKLYRDKHYSEAAAILEPFYEAGPDRVGWYWNSAMYDLACEEALAGRKQKALDVLAAWQASGTSVSAEQLATDNDLASLHGDPQFTRLVDQLRIQERLWTSEPGQALAFTSSLSEDAKIAGLSTVWSEARFNFAYFDRQPNLDWNQTYLDYISKVRSTTSTEEYYRVLMRFVALLKDGHTNVYPPQAIRDAFYGGPGLHTRLVDKSVVVTGVDDPALLTQGWHVGDVILKIDGEDIQRYASREIAPYQSSSTPQDLEVRTFNYALLSGRAGSSFHVTVRNREGKDEDRTLTRLTLQDQAKLKTAPPASFNMRPDGIAVLTINEFDDTEGTKALLANLSSVASSKGLVIDVRANGGGSTPVDLLQVLTRKPVRGALVQTRSYVAAYRAKGVLPGWTAVPPFEVPPDPAHHVDVPVAVLTGAQTFSAAEDFVAAFDAMHRGITLGETTAGSTGQPLFFQLPGGGSARVCTRNDQASDGTVFEGIGLRPTISVSPTVASIQQGTDTVLDRAAAALLAMK
jgi:carboxyl-terminal processing protease